MLFKNQFIVVTVFAICCSKEYNHLNVKKYPLSKWIPKRILKVSYNSYLAIYDPILKKNMRSSLVGRGWNSKVFYTDSDMGSHNIAHSDKSK